MHRLKMPQGAQHGLSAVYMRSYPISPETNRFLVSFEIIFKVGSMRSNPGTPPSSQNPVYVDSVENRSESGNRVNEADFRDRYSAEYSASRVVFDRSGLRSCDVPIVRLEGWIVGQRLENHRRLGGLSVNRVARRYSFDAVIFVNRPFP